MSILRNPNVRRLMYPLTFALVIGAAACGDSEPSPNKTVTAAPAPANTDPTCAVITRVDGYTVHARVTATNEEEPGNWSFGSLDYNFGDGIGVQGGHGKEEATYTYPAAGEYTVYAAMTLDIAHGGEIPQPRAADTPGTSTIGCAGTRVVVPVE